MFSIKIKPCAKKLTHKNYLMLSHVNPEWKPILRESSDKMIKKECASICETQLWNLFVDY